MYLNTFQSTKVSSFSLDIITIAFKTQYRRSKFRPLHGLTCSLSMSVLIARIVKFVQRISFLEKPSGGKIGEFYSVNY